MATHGMPTRTRRRCPARAPISLFRIGSLKTEALAQGGWGSHVRSLVCGKEAAHNLCALRCQGHLVEHLGVRAEASGVCVGSDGKTRRDETRDTRGNGIRHTALSITARGCSEDVGSSVSLSVHGGASEVHWAGWALARGLSILRGLLEA